MKNWNFISLIGILKLVGLGLACLIVYHKPLYTLWFILVLFYEYLWFINFLINIRRNSTNYYIIKIEKLDLSDKNIIEIWVEYCKLLAFKRLYLLLMKNKKVSALGVLKVFFFILFGIPIKFLNLCYHFLFKSQGGFKMGLESLYINLYYTLKECKIEILNKDIYLNCFTLGKLCKSVLKQNSLITEANFLKGMRTLKQQAKEFEKFEKEISELNLIMAKDKDGKQIYGPHYG